MCVRSGPAPETRLLLPDQAEKSSRDSTIGGIEPHFKRWLYVAAGMGYNTDSRASVEFGTLSADL